MYHGQHVYSTGGMGVWPACVQHWGYVGMASNVYSTGGEGGGGGGMANMCIALGPGQHVYSPRVWPTCV